MSQLTPSLRKEILDALLLLPNIGEARVRDQLLLDLPQELRFLIPRDNSPLIDLSNMLNTADHWGDAELHQLLNNALILAPGSRAHKILKELLRRIHAPNRSTQALTELVSDFERQPSVQHLIAKRVRNLRIAVLLVILTLISGALFTQYSQLTTTARPQITATATLTPSTMNTYTPVTNALLLQATPTALVARPTETVRPKGEIAYDLNGDLWLVNVTTQQTRKLTTDGTNYQPAWSPDGISLAFISTKEGESKVYMMELNGSPRKMTDGPFPDSLPTFSSNGGLFFVRDESRAPDTIGYVVMNWVPGGEPSVEHIPGIISTGNGGCQVIGLNIKFGMPYALSSGCTIRAGNWITLVNPSSNDNPTLSDYFGAGPCQEGGKWAHFSPTLAFISRSCDFDVTGQRLTLMVFDGSPEGKDIFTTDRIWSLDWSPDDQFIAFSNREGIWAISPQGGKPHQIITFPPGVNNVNLAWRPD